MGKLVFDYDGEDIWIGAEKYKATKGLWELIFSNNPDRNTYDIDDFAKYKEILRQTNVGYNYFNPKNKLKEIDTIKFNKIIKPFYKAIYRKGITIIPSDPNALLKRLDLLMASKKAGNTGVRNELVSICDELKRQRVLNTKSYKKLMTIL